MKYRIAIICFFFIVQTYSQNSLKNAKEDISNTYKPTTNSTYSSINENSSTSNSISSSLFYDLTIGLVTGVFVESIFEHKTLSQESKITPYPYLKKTIGDFDYYNTYKGSRILLSDRYLSNDKQQGNYFNTEFQFLKRFSLTADFLFLKEENTFGSPERYKHYTLAANYYRIRTQKFSLWYGIGVRYVEEGVNKYGFSYNIGTRIYIVKPVSFEFLFLGSIVNGKSVNHLYTQLKWHINRMYIMGGYDQIKISSYKFDMFGMGIGIYL